jgi:CheY-like chemotaxis protein
MAGDGTATVLVVDDDAAWRELLIELLELEGIRAEGAANGAEALARLRWNAPLPDAILTDLSMPRMTGWELCAALLHDVALAGIPVGILSGEEQPRCPSAARVLRKSCAPEEIVAAVRDLAAMRGAA